MSLDIFKDVEDVIGKTGIKILIYGKAGVGKSTFVGSFPEILLIDSEDGQKFYLKENPNFLKVAKTQSVSEVGEALKMMNDEDVLSGFTTIAIDSYSKIYDNMQDTAFKFAEKREIEKKARGENANVETVGLSLKEWGTIGRWNRELNSEFTLLSSLGKIVLVTAREKEITKPKYIKGELVNVPVGYAPDLKKAEEYDWDIVIRLVEEKDDATGEPMRVGYIMKDRVWGMQKPTPRKEINPSFETWKEKFEEYVNFKPVEATDYSKDVDKSVEDKKKEEIDISKIKKDIDDFINSSENKKEDKSKVINYAQSLGLKSLNGEVEVSKLEKIKKFIDNGLKEK